MAFRLKLPKCYLKIFNIIFFINIWIILLFLNMYQGFEDNLDNKNNVDTINNFINVHERNDKRLELLHETCLDSGLKNGDVLSLPVDQLENIFIDKEHKLLYCYIPKVACTVWKQILLKLTGKWDNTNFQDIPHALAHEVLHFTRFINLTVDEKKDVLKSYTKFMIVRDPFERLLSAYKDKLGNYTSAPPFFQSVARIIVHNKELLKKFTPLKPMRKGDHPYDITFPQFIQYLLTPFVSTHPNKRYNEHWDPMYNLCHPCKINYTVLAKYETIEEDSNYVLDLIGVKDIRFPPNKMSMTKNKLSDYFDAIPLDIVRDLYELYYKDFKLFGYSPEQVLNLNRETKLPQNVRRRK